MTSGLFCYFQDDDSSSSKDIKVGAFVSLY